MIKDILKKISLLINEIKSQNLEITSEEENNESGLLYLSVKIVGKCTLPIPKDPLILLKESGSKSHFSKDDFNWILATILENQKRIIEKKYKKRLTLIKHQFSEQLEEPLIVYKDQITNQIYIKPAKEIYSNIEQIKQFSSEDSACIGNIVGCNETEKDYKFCREHKKDNVFKFDISSLTG
ncbi:TPA: hypothetical protein JBH59_02515 [Legionella pneumophila]|uniref:hypothetical protein n=1 Tax=Legionella pneumophila TaxID=446 RepID=UPI001A22FBAC|nr:hypothetical protein [Legionella pneumophila]MDI9826390.1 hypothetical protein [Legionella pneumophila]HAU0908683.1 hypothetical protein [Legionella pneumophila]HAU1359055.1 hypothetical protein [Legionella pneumophila]HAU1458220.1 hypothetical protein [Legionella pneumophila]HBD7230968.1 hypothetical protein [Legionella pneumophila]